MKICDCAEYLKTEGNWTISCYKQIFRCWKHKLIYIRNENGTITTLGRQDEDFEKYWFYGY